MGQLPLLRSSLKECMRFGANKVAKFKESILLPVITLSKKQKNIFVVIIKVENILKGSLDSIPSPSPSVKIQIMGWKVEV